ncbi:hypothetical protein [Bradyrhizobium sp. SZCCHNS3004]|uniref:hypothetical protein n=1 Tax=Bradyrhizobium sp. SZCCHNS3004 TaxID=3057312 RepID=UPI002916B5D6|nr:hypothetical protein [Bradyrhizobium sp. SZCCHNS3004]
MMAVEKNFVIDRGSQRFGFLSTDYAARLTDIKSKTPGEAAGRFRCWDACSCEADRVRSLRDF